MDALRQSVSGGHYLDLASDRSKFKKVQSESIATLPKSGRRNSEFIPDFWISQTNLNFPDFWTFQILFSRLSVFQAFKYSKIFQILYPFLNPKPNPVYPLPRFLDQFSHSSHSITPGINMDSRDKYGGFFFFYQFALRLPNSKSPRIIVSLFRDFLVMMRLTTQLQSLNLNSKKTNSTQK